MQLPLSSSVASISDSDDLLTNHLMLANANAEMNRVGYDAYEDYSDASPVTPQAYQRVLQFNPEVTVRFIRPRSGTIMSSFSDICGTIRCADSPLQADCKQTLKESSPLSEEDDEFDRFYKTMECRGSLNSRRFSMDESIPVYRSTSRLTPNFQHHNRQRSLSCDD